MAFDDLPPQSPINPKADAYARQCLDLSAAVRERARGAFDVPFGDDYWQKLDIYRPDDTPAAGAGLPVFVFFHGGGWTHGYKEWCGFMAPAVTAIPAIFVSGSYRLMPAAPHPAGLDDAFATIAWLRDNIARHGGDPARIHVGGHSAGAHMAALLVLDRERRARAGLGPGAIRSCFPVSATFSKRMVNEQAAPQFAPKEPLDEPDADSPLALAGNGDGTPFYIVWGSEERDRVRNTGAAMVKALTAAGTRVEWEEIPGADHFTSHLDTRLPGNRWAAKLGAWIAGGR